MTCDKKWIFYDNWWWPAQWLDWEEAPKHFPKPNLHKKRSRSLSDGLLQVWSTTAFWILTKSLHLRKYAEQIDEMPPKLQHLELVLVNRMGPILLHDNTWLHIIQPMLQKLSELGHKVLPHLPYSPDLLATDYDFFKHFDNFCRENTSTSSSRQKMVSKSLSNPKARVFMLQE